MNILAQYISKQNVPPSSLSVNSQSPKVFSSPDSSTKTSIFYINDLHGQIPKMQRLASAANYLGHQARANGADYLKLCSGDTFIGSDENRNKAAACFLDVAGIDAQTLGNHEFDITASKCAELLKNSRTKNLGMNLNFPNASSPLAQHVSRSTVIQSNNGDKYGVIGVQPSDLYSRVKKKEILEGITTDDKEQTIKELQEEVNKLKQQGLNKIILLSHEGTNVEKEIAQRVSGIDVILGGHSHNLIEGVKQGENLLYSPSGEPVIITQAGRDGNNFGLLNLEFNDKGHVTYVQNNIIDTNTFSPDLIMTKTVDSILGKSPVVGTLGYSDPIPKNNLLEENPWADFVADSIKNSLDAEIVLINSANFRGSVDKGVVTERDISSIFPFNNKLYKVKINEEDLVDAIKKCGKSLVSKNSKPGILQVGGLTYTLDSQGNLLDLYYIDKKGEKHAINVSDPDDDKYYTAVYDEFLIGGGDDLDMLKRDNNEIIEKYSFDKDKVTNDYIRTLSQPFEVRKDNRIKILK